MFIAALSTTARGPDSPSVLQPKKSWALGRMRAAGTSLEICELLIMLGEHHASERSLAESHVLYGSVSRK